MQNTLEKFIQISKNLLDDESRKPVADFIPSEELFETLDLELSMEPMAEGDFEAALENLVLKSPRTATVGFFNQLFGGRNPHAVLGDLLAVMLNNSMYTYKAAGAQIGVEKVILRRVCDMLGWDHNSDGTLALGGSMTNFMAMLMARDACDAELKRKGVKKSLMVYTSKESHYSIPKNAAFSGIGRDQVRYIPTDDFGRIDINLLTQAVEGDLARGLTPAMINLTAGTTVLGAFDPIEPVVELAKKHGIWVHVDGAYCGSVLFSNRYRPLIKGIEKVDSFSFNAHKMLGTPLSCSIIVTKNKRHLHESFSNDASYLYQTDHDEFNLGKMSLQCGRRNDALKFWALWKSVGTKGLEQIVDHQFYLAEVARKYISGNSDYTLYSYPDSISVCFNYKDIPARVLCTELYEAQELLVGYGAYGPNEFVRLVTINAQNNAQVIKDFFKTLEEFANKNYERLRPHSSQVLS